MTGINMKVAAIVAGVVVLGAGAYFISNRSGSNGAMEQANVSGSQQTSLRSLMGAGSPVRCTFTSTEGGYTSNGTVYVANGMMRGDFMSLGTPTGDVESHMVVKDDTSYVWSSSMEQGIKMSVNASTETSAQNQTAVSYDANIDYDCDSWAVDAGLFELPSSVEFMDMSAMMQGAMQGSGSVQSGMPLPEGANANLTNENEMQVEQCAACEQLSGAQQAACKAALQCE